MTSEEIEAIVGGYHGDAFRILGPHDAGKRQWEIRAFLPQAQSAEVIGAGLSLPMEKLHAEGFFCAPLEGTALNGHSPDYRIRAQLWDGREAVIDDPYRYPTQISDHDIYLYTEGTL